MPQYTAQDESACLNAGGVIDYMTNQCCSPGGDCAPLAGYAGAQGNGGGAWVGYVPTLTDSLLDVLGFFGAGARPQYQTPPGTGGQKKNYTPWIILGGLVVVAVATYFLMRNKKKS